VVKVIFMRVNEALSRSGLPDLDYALNPYLGCEHSCIYCYAREYTPDEEVSRNWGAVIKVKENIVELLKKEVRRRRKGIVGLSTITDPYQPIEKELCISRRCLEVLLENGFPVSIQTKSNLVIRDLDILTRYTNLVDVGLTITSTSKEISELIEPHAPPPEERIAALYRLSEAGINTWLFYGPIIPKVNDSDDIIRELVRIAKDTNSEFYYDKLRIKRFMFRSSNKVLRNSIRTIRDYDWNALYSKIEKLCAEYNVPCKPAFDVSETKYYTLDKYIHLN